MARYKMERLRLAVGLGNPGAAYRATRHNIGFKVVEILAERFSIAINKNKFDTVFGRGYVENVVTILAKPMAYMNRSGTPVQKLSNYFRISSEDILVVHDDIDLAFGRLKIKEKGGHGGHKGVSSLMDALGSGNFPRLRVGVGRSGTGLDVKDHVLGRFSPEESEILNPVMTRAVDAVVAVLCKGVKHGMNRFNDKRLQWREG